MKDYYFYFTGTDGLVRIIKLGHKKRRRYVQYKNGRPDNWYVGKVFKLYGNPRGFGRSPIGPRRTRNE